MVQIIFEGDDFHNITSFKYNSSQYTLPKVNYSQPVDNCTLYYY